MREAMGVLGGSQGGGVPLPNFHPKEGFKQSMVTVIWYLLFASFERWLSVRGILVTS